MQYVKKQIFRKFYIKVKKKHGKWRWLPRGHWSVIKMGRWSQCRDLTFTRFSTNVHVRTPRVICGVMVTLRPTCTSPVHIHLCLHEVMRYRWPGLVLLFVLDIIIQMILVSLYCNRFTATSKFSFTDDLFMTHISCSLIFC